MSEGKLPTPEELRQREKDEKRLYKHLNRKYGKKPAAPAPAPAPARKGVKK